MPELGKFYRDNQSRAGLVLIDVNDQESAIRSLISSGGYQFPVVLDPTGAAGGLYGLKAVPTLVVVNSLGSVTKFHVGGISSADLSALVDGAAR
jgi:uncharacterized membrane protein